ncbi:MAG TPA: hypothetical protein VN408_40085 [Actinoplanes sp.]|nr:hypothetical protein [Actinoplanes sp.]
MTELETAPAEPAVPPADPWSGWDPLISAAGIVVSVLAIVVTAFIELALSPLRTGALGAVVAGDSPFVATGFAVPLSVPLAVWANLAIGWFTVFTTGRRALIGLPWALWTLIMLLASGSRTAEGDFLLTESNWVAVVTILAGSLTFAVHAYMLIFKPAPPAVPVPTGSGLPGGVQ